MPCNRPAQRIGSGTDSFGRDLLTRLIYAAGIDLQMAFFGVVGPFVIGTTIGLLSGNFGGRADAVLMRILDITVSFPYFVLVIAIVAVLRPGLDQLLHLPDPGELGLLCPARALPGHRAQICGFRAGGAHHRAGRASGDDASPPSQCHRARRGLRHDRCGADHRARLLPRLPGPGRAAADGGMGRHDRRRPDSISAPPGGSASFPASPSRCWRWAFRWSPTGSPGCCIPSHERRHPSHGRGSGGRIRDGPWAGAGAARRLLRHRIAARCWASSGRAARARRSPAAR